MTKPNPDHIHQFAIDYNHMQLLLLNSNTMKEEYQVAVSNAIDIMQDYAKEHYNLIFEEDVINWAASFPENYHGIAKSSNPEKWLKAKGYL